MSQNWLEQLKRNAVNLFYSIDRPLIGPYPFTPRTNRTTARPAPRGNGEYMGPGYMSESAIFSKGRGRVGGGNAGASQANQWSVVPQLTGGTGGNARDGGTGGNARDGGTGGNSGSTIPEQVAQYQAATMAAENYKNKVDALINKFGGKAEHVNDLALLTKAPIEFKPQGAEQAFKPSLSDYYSAQDLTGQAIFDKKNNAFNQDVFNEMTGKLGYDENMKTWAEANPMLAQRELARMLEKERNNPTVDKSEVSESTKLSPEDPDRGAPSPYLSGPLDPKQPFTWSSTGPQSGFVITPLNLTASPVSPDIGDQLTNAAGFSSSQVAPSSLFNSGNLNLENLQMINGAQPSSTTKTAEEILGENNLWENTKSFIETQSGANPTLGIQFLQQLTKSSR